MTAEKGREMTERTSIWLLIVLPVVVALVLLVPLACVSGSGSCAEDAPCPPGETTCYSLVGIPANGLVAALGIAGVGAAGTAGYLRWLRRSRP